MTKVVELFPIYWWGEENIMDKFSLERTDLNSFGTKASIRKEGMRDQLEWIKRQLEYASFSEKFELRFDLKQGEIYEIDWGININAEFSNRHFGVVLVDSDATNPLVTVCPLKTNHGSIHPTNDVDLGFIRAINNAKSTVAVINQIRTIDKLRIYTKRSISRPSERRLYDSEDNENIEIMRLENDKFLKLMSAYFSYLNSKNQWK